MKIKILLVLAVAYLLGSIPFGLIVGKLVTGKDIRDQGSGNTGATNAYRLMGLGFGLLVALLDIGKGVAAVKIAQMVLGQSSELLILLAGVMAIVGHNLSIFLKFDGGRGVATSVGVLGSLAPVEVLIVGAIWFTIILLTRYVSLGSITGAVILPILMFAFGKPNFIIIFGVLISAFVIYSHKDNINRLLNGNENKISWPND
ncbi:glycerol-3-phosphate 1-O-acyltransferase PlsY [Halanaerobacter jeridensis]